jgi:hypothetical protein
MMRYCDGASFSGNNETSASYKGTTLYWRGMRIREAMVADLLKKGLSKATDLMVRASNLPSPWLLWGRSHA